MSARPGTHEAALAALDDAGVSYIVQRGHAHWPLVEGDLDLLVSPAHLERAIAATWHGLSEASGAPVVVCRHVDLPVLAALGPGPTEIAEIDLATTTSWAAGSFLDEARVLAERRRLPNGLWTAAPGDESALLGVPALLGTGAARRSKGVERLPRIKELITTDPTGARVAWQEAVGVRAAERVLAAIAAGDLAALARLALVVRPRRAVQNGLRAPSTTARRIAFVAWNRQRQAQCGLWHARGRRLVPLRSLPVERPWDEIVHDVVLSHPEMPGGGAG